MSPHKTPESIGESANHVMLRAEAWDKIQESPLTQDTLMKGGLLRVLVGLASVALFGEETVEVVLVRGMAGESGDGIIFACRPQGSKNKDGVMVDFSVPAFAKTPRHTVEWMRLMIWQMVPDEDATTQEREALEARMRSMDE